MHLLGGLRQQWKSARSSIESTIGWAEAEVIKQQLIFEFGAIA